MTDRLPKPAAVELDDDMRIEVQARHIHAANRMLERLRRFEV